LESRTYMAERHQQISTASIVLRCFIEQDTPAFLTACLAGQLSSRRASQR